MEHKKHDKEDAEGGSCGKGVWASATRTLDRGANMQLKNLKFWRGLGATTLAALVVMAGAALPGVAREPDEPPRSEDSRGRGRDDAPDLKHHGTQVGRTGKGDGKAGGRPDVLPSDIKVMVDKFKADREKFLSQQQELERQLKQDSKSNRDALREQLKANLDRWKEQQKEFRDRLKERMRDIKEEVPELERVFKSGGENNSGSHGGKDRSGSN
jgi:gas vesicle protein